jgi:hypothetical protein
MLHSPKSMATVSVKYSMKNGMGIPQSRRGANEMNMLPAPTVDHTHAHIPQDAQRVHRLLGAVDPGDD